jgi:hypothetical protein
MGLWTYAPILGRADPFNSEPAGTKGPARRPAKDLKKTQTHSQPALAKKNKKGTRKPRCC